MTCFRAAAIILDGPGRGAPGKSRGTLRWSDSYFWNGLYQVATWSWTNAAACMGV